MDQRLIDEAMTAPFLDEVRPQRVNPIGRARRLSVSLCDLSQWRVARRSPRSRVNTTAARWVRTNGLEQATLSADQRDLLRGMLAGALLTGQSEAVLAGRVAREIELTPQMRETLRTFETRLKTAQGGSVVTSELLEVRVPKRGLTDSQVRSWVDRYERRLLLYRAQTIVHFELRQARNAAQLELWRAELPANTERVWRQGGEDSCPQICADMIGETVRLGEEWELPDGRLIGTPPAHPYCDCYEDVFVPKTRKEAE